MCGGFDEQVLHQNVINCLSECLAIEMPPKAKEQAQLSLQHATEAANLYQLFNNSSDTDKSKTSVCFLSTLIIVVAGNLISRPRNPDGHQSVASNGRIVWTQMCNMSPYHA
eukprot:Em0001g1367a